MNQPILEFIQPFDGLLLFMTALLVFLWVRGGLSRDMLQLFYRFTQDARKAHQIHLFFTFPGVFLHEFSHWLVLRLLGVRCSLHLGIEMHADFVVYGHVDYYESDVNAVKHFLSGIAPLISGIIVINLLAVNCMGIPSPHTFADQEFAAVLESVLSAAHHWPFWLAFYFIFAITSEMVPSPSDRKYWLPLAVILTALVVLSILTKTTTWFIANLYPALNNGLKIMGIVFLIGLVPQCLLWLPLQIGKLLRRRH